MSSPGNYAKGYVRWTAGGKRVMWDGCRWQQLCQIEKCFKRDQKSQGVCLIHFREQQEQESSKTKNKNKKFKQEEKIEKPKSNKEKKSSQTKTTSISTRSKRVKSNNSLNNSTKVFDNDISDSEITKRKSSTSNLSPSKSQKPSRTLILVCSSLTRQQLSQVELFCTRFSARLSNQIDETTTHLIASEVDPRVCCLTKKVFFCCCLSSICNWLSMD